MNLFVQTACSESRKACIKSAYDLLGSDGVVKLDDIAKGFDPNGNPDVIAGNKSDQDVFMEFMGLWGTQVKDGQVSFEEFCAYHEDISSLIESDESFEVYMKASFGKVE